MPITTEAPRTLADKRKAAEAAVDVIEKDYGKGSIFNMGSRKIVPWPSRPTGIYSVDYGVLGIGGLPKGRIVEIYGPESGGKTTFCLQAIAQSQGDSELAAYIDPENALDPKWATHLGCDMNGLYLSQPDNGEQALEILEDLLESQAFGIIVVDSVAALIPKSELEGDFGDAQMGGQAKLMSQAMRKLTKLVSSSGSTVIFINQIREKIGVMFGSPETTTGGRALKFFASVRLDVRRFGHVKEGDKIIGNQTRIKAVKNKLFAPFRETELNLLYTKGFDKAGDLVNAAIAAKLVVQDKSWYAYKESKFQGIAQLNDGLTPEQLSDILKSIKELTRE